MTNLLAEFPRIDAVFAINDPTAIGCDLAAKRQQRKDLFIVGVDGAPDVVPYLKEENSLIAASVAQDPYAMARKAVELGYDVLNGKKAEPSLTLIPVDLITRENVRGYKGWEEPALTPTPTPTPTPIAKDPRVVPILYATNRVRKMDAPDKFPRFSSERSPTLTFGSALVRVPENHVFGTVDRPGEKTYWFIFTEREEERAKDHFTLPDVRVLTKQEFLRSIHDSQTNGQTSSALLFVHGFNTNFEDAIFRLAQIKWDTQYSGVPIAFSWPSRGENNAIAYNYDRESAAYSHFAFLEVLHLLQASVSKVYIVAHSMGNQILMDSIDTASQGDEKLSLAEVVLAAPDVDWDAFQLSGHRLTDVAKGVTLYASSTDMALLASNMWNGGGKPRAGFIPETGPLILPGIETIDVTALGPDIFALTFNHDVTLRVRPVLDDIGHLLSDGRHPPNIRSPEIRGIPEGSVNPRYWIFPK